MKTFVQTKYRIKIVIIVAHIIKSLRICILLSGCGFWHLMSVGQHFPLPAACIVHGGIVVEC